MATQVVGIVGCGMIGTGLIELAAEHGLTVVAVKLTGDPAAAVTRLGRSLEKRVARGALSSEARDAALARVRITGDFDQLALCDATLECCVERPEIKRRILETAESCVRPGTLLATNTSSLGLAELSRGLLRPCRFVGVRFFDPSSNTRHAEISPAPRTAQSVLEGAAELVRRMGRVPLRVDELPHHFAGSLRMGERSSAA